MVSNCPAKEHQRILMKRFSVSPEGPGSSLSVFVGKNELLTWLAALSANTTPAFISDAPSARKPNGGTKAESIRSRRKI